MTKARLLIVDDEIDMLRLLERSIGTELDWEIALARSGEEALELIEKSPFDLALVDIRMPGMDGIETLQRIKQTSPSTGVIMMTAYASVETAVSAMKLGAFDYITKPIDIDEVRRVVGNWTEGTRDTGESEGEHETALATDIVGASEALRSVLGLAHRVAESDASVLLLGESGTGKDVVAREIHRSGARARKPFVAVNCSAIPEGLLESELFGHEKGSFTGAVRQKRGKFETADGGTVFLDEIGDMSEALQAKLLRFLQDHIVQRVGGSVDIPVDVRVVAATNKDLEAEVARGRFREDLYFRLNVVTITLPPLRERDGDVPLLIEHFLRVHSAAGRKPKKFSPSAIRMALNYDWPGNVRELENAVQRAVVLTRGETIFPEQLPAKVQASASDREGAALTGGRTMREVERDTIIKTLRQTDGNRTHAAKILGISRRTLQNKIKEYDIDL
jgi:two-component system, NtrC family, response regulator HydG